MINTKHLCYSKLCWQTKETNLWEKRKLVSGKKCSRNGFFDMPSLISLFKKAVSNSGGVFSIAGIVADIEQRKKSFSVTQFSIKHEARKLSHRKSSILSYFVQKKCSMHVQTNIYVGQIICMSKRLPSIYTELKKLKSFTDNQTEISKSMSENICSS